MPLPLDSEYGWDRTHSARISPQAVNLSIPPPWAMAPDVLLGGKGITVIANEESELRMESSIL